MEIKSVVITTKQIYFKEIGDYTVNAHNLSGKYIVYLDWMGVAIASHRRKFKSLKKALAYCEELRKMAENATGDDDHVEENYELY